MNTAIAFLLAATSVPLAAQWLNYPDPRTPRSKDGKPNLTAPAPRLNGKPDLSGRPPSGHDRDDFQDDPSAPGDRDSNRNWLASAPGLHRWAPLAQRSRPFLDGVFSWALARRYAGGRNQRSQRQGLARRIWPPAQRSHAHHRALSPPRFRPYGSGDHLGRSEILHAALHRQDGTEADPGQRRS